MSTDQFLCGVRAVVLEPGLGKGRTRILCKQLETRGGRLESSISDATTHLLVGNSVRRSRLPVLLGAAEVPPGVRVVRADWLSSCLARGEWLREEEYEVPLENISRAPTSASNSPSKAEDGQLLESREGGEGEGGDKAVVGGFPMKEEAEGERTEAGEGQGVESGVEDQLCVAERVGKLGSGLRVLHMLVHVYPVLTIQFPTSSRRWLGEHTSPGKNKRASPDSDSDYVDSGGEGEGEGQLADVDISTVPPLAKRKVWAVCPL